jgi:hypothetical protein
LSIVTTSGVGVVESAVTLTGGMVFEHQSRPTFGSSPGRSPSVIVIDDDA